MLCESCQGTTKTEVVSERRFERGEGTNLVDDTSMSACRVPLALTLSEVCRRGGESAISPDFKASSSCLYSALL